MKTFLTITKWAIGIVFIINAMRSLLEYPMAALVYLILGVVILPFTMRFIEDRIFKTTINRFAKWTVVIAGIFLLSFLMVGIADKQDAVRLAERNSRGRNELDKVYRLIETSQLDSAIAHLNSLVLLDSINPTLKDSILTLSVMVDKSMSDEYMQSTMVGMSNTDYTLLINGKYDKAFLENESLNKNFVKFLIDNKNNRPKYIAEKRKNDLKIEKEMILAKERVDAERIQAKLAAEIAAKHDRVKKQFSVYDGSHRKLEQYIKANMNDPDSYEHIETQYWVRDSHIVVRTKFRGRNGFGGKVVASARGEVSYDNEVLNVDME
jgi:hypothetical protein